MRRFPDDLFRNDAVAQNVLRMVNVVQKQIERGDALHQPALDQFPFLRRNDARNEIERENPFRSLVVVVDGEGNALAEKRGGGQGAFALEFFALHFREALEQFAVMGPRHAGAGKHFVEKFSDFVIGEKVAHEFSLAARKIDANENGEKKGGDGTLQTVPGEYVARKIPAIPVSRVTNSAL